VHDRVLLGRLREKHHLEDSGVDRRIITKIELEELGWGGRDWIALAENMDRWWPSVNAVTKHLVP